MVKIAKVLKRINALKKTTINIEIRTYDEAEVAKIAAALGNIPFSFESGACCADFIIKLNK